MFKRATIFGMLLCLCEVCDAEQDQGRIFLVQQDFGSINRTFFVKAKQEQFRTDKATLFYDRNGKPMSEQEVFALTLSPKTVRFEYKADGTKEPLATKVTVVD